MHIIDSAAMEIEEQDIFKKIERCGRVCYKSEEQITEGSALNFVNMLIERKHWAMLEHAPIVLQVTERLARAVLRVGHSTFLNVTCNGILNRYIISGSVRAWLTLFTSAHFESMLTEPIRNSLEYRMQASLGKEHYALLFPHLHPVMTYQNYILTQDDVLSLPSLSPGESMAHLYLTSHFICDRGVSHELVRHRPASFAQESTRYCNYGKDKFGKEITLINPKLGGKAQIKWLKSMKQSERIYMELLDLGVTPQMARTVLPNSLKTEIIVTTCLEEWQHIINLRYHGNTGAPHPQMKELMELWYNIVKSKKGYSEWLN